MRQLNEQREAFREFKKYLNDVTKWMRERKIKLVIIVDELDRCKPTFAVRTLEIVKHIFDIENIVFLFAIDAKQLSHSISSIYGYDFDSVGYLCRFFDYIAKIPTPDIKQYIYGKLETIKTIPNRVITKQENNLQRPFWKEVADFIFEIYNAFEFSLRDLETLVQSYKIILNRYLKNYEMLGAHKIYLFYLAIKYKKPRLFEKIFLNFTEHSENILDELEPFIRQNFDSDPWLIASIKTLCSSLILQHVELMECDENGKELNGPYKVYHLKEGLIQVLCGDESTGWQISRPYYPIDEFKMKSMGNIVFYPDLERWKKTMQKTYREYLHEQLEMYRFLPGIDISYETEI